MRPPLGASQQYHQPPGPQFRSPKPEGRKKAEVRNPKSEKPALAPLVALITVFGPGHPDVRLLLQLARHPADTLAFSLQPLAFPRNHAPPRDEHIRFQARVVVPPGTKPDGWEVLRDAHNEALPPPRSRKAGG